ncbi:MAG: T9SS type A sorting domain-containing protein [Cyclobacteriaceae bacterium]
MGNRAVFSSLMILLHYTFAIAQLSEGPNNPTNATSDNTVGSIPWNNAGNTFSSDDSRAIASSLVVGSNQTEYLLVSDFGFSIPSNAAIRGIEVEIERSKDALGLVTDTEVRLVKGGTVTGSNLSGGSWPTSDTYQSYGGSSELWGTTWDYNDINASDFGVALSSTLTGVSVNISAGVDHIRTIVYYDVLLPISLSGFEVELKQHNAIISWEVSSQKNNAYFEIERSGDGVSFQPIARFRGNGTTSKTLSYQYIDQNPLSGTSYYRLVQSDYDGNRNLCGMKSLVFEAKEIGLVSEMVNDRFICSTYGLHNTPYDLVILNLQGQLIIRKSGVITDNIEENFHTFDPGIYIYHIKAGKAFSSGRFVKN